MGAPVEPPAPPAEPKPKPRPVEPPEQTVEHVPEWEEAAPPPPPPPPPPEPVRLPERAPEPKREERPRPKLEPLPEPPPRLHRVPEPGAYIAVIRVVGVGGAGLNAVNRMIDADISQVEFVAVLLSGDGLPTRTERLEMPPHLTDPALRGFAQNTLPVLQRHLQMVSGAGYVASAR